MRLVCLLFLGLILTLSVRAPSPPPVSSIAEGFGEQIDSFLSLRFPHIPASERKHVGEVPVNLDVSVFLPPIFPFSDICSGFLTTYSLVDVALDHRGITNRPSYDPDPSPQSRAPPHPKHRPSHHSLRWHRPRCFRHTLLSHSTRPTRTHP